jgi:hypothetical protein
VTQGDDSCNQTRRKKSIQNEIEDIPEPDIKSPYFPELAEFIAQEPSSEDIKDDFNDVEISSRIDRVNCAGIKSQIDEREDDLCGILVNGRAHAIGVNVSPVVCISFLLVLYELRGIIFILYEPSSPEIIDALLVSRRTRNSKRMKINCSLNDIRRCGLLPINQNRISLKKHILQKVIVILFRFNPTHSISISVVFSSHSRRAKLTVASQ